MTRISEKGISRGIKCVVLVETEAQDAKSAPLRLHD